jgi:uncharacterized protein (DUF427 family)
MTKTVKIPGPDHPITITPYPGHVVVRAGGKIVADSRAALVLREASYPVVHYIPRADVDMAQLERSDHTTYCPYKGDANYFRIGARDAVWTYEQPYDAVVQIKAYVAFYPDRVDGIDLD